MLSAHEIAALILIHDARGLSSIDQADMRVLANRHLIVLSDAGPGAAAPALTPVGLSLVQCLARMRGDPAGAADAAGAAEFEIDDAG